MRWQQITLSGSVWCSDVRPRETLRHEVKPSTGARRGEIKKKALRAEHQETATCFRSHAVICDRCNDSQTKNNNWGAHDKWNVSTSSFRTGSCQHNDSQCCTSIWASARSLNTVSQSFHESALWKLILIPLHSYKSLFHEGSALTASLVLYHRETVYGEGIWFNFTTGG